MKKRLLLFILMVLSVFSLNAQWSAVGTGVRHSPSCCNVEVTRIVVYNGELYAGGYFDSAGSIPAKYIARWNGTAWDSVGTGLGGSNPSPEPHALGVYNSVLYAGGEFTSAGGVPANHAAKWDGNTWSEMGGGTSNGTGYQCPFAFIVHNGELYVGGSFATVGGIIPVNYIAKWNGTTWSAVGGGMAGSNNSNEGVYALAVYNGELYAGGSYDTAGGVPANSIAKWNGISWSALGNGLTGGSTDVLALAVYNGELYAGGEFTTAGGITANHIAKWNGTTWSAVGTGMNGFRVSALEVYNGELYAGGNFTTAGGISANRIAKWNGTTWSAVGSGMNNPVNALTIYNNELYAGGFFTTAGGISANRIARWTSCTVAPPQPGAISGSNAVCQGSSQTYSISAVSGATSYTWTLPAGWTGTSTTNSITATVGANSGSICVTANNSCGSSTAQCLVVTVNPVPLQPGTITGNNSVCQGSSQTYSISAVSGATSYTWTLPSGWTGSSTTTSITATVGANSGSICVTANNSCGASSAQCLVVTVNSVPLQPGTITGNNSVCQGSSQTYFIGAVSGATSYTWTLPSGWTGSSTTTSITATVGANGGNISVTANNSCGSSPAQSLAVTVNPVPAQPGSITGNNAVCQGSSQTYSISAVSGATSYTWTLPSGWTGTSTTTSITATVGANGGNISVTANNSCGSSPAQTLAVTVNPTPAQPGIITGNNAVCQGSSQTYSISAVSGATSYTWTLPSGWTGSSTTTSITATVGANSGNVSVTANNSCGSSTPQILAVTVNSIPAQPGAISGNNSVCQGSSQTYSISAVSGATSYTWTLPSGWTGTSTTTSITATVGANSGTISVTANNSCGSSTAQTLAVTVVNSVPAQPGAISGSNSVCQGSSQTYSISAVSGATSYTWTLPSGWTGTSTTTSITTTVGASGGNISVTANNSCGSSPAQTLAVTVNTTPAQPGTITGNNSVCLGSSQTYSISAVSGATSYTWILPSGWSGSSTTTSITATVGANSGNISVTANNSCGSSTAQTLAVTVNSTPAQPGTISGNNSVCQGNSQTYSISTVSGATSYTWTLPSGWTGTSTTTSITATVGASGGNISVTANNSCGSSSAQTLAVTVNSTPAQPGTITGNNSVCQGSSQTYSISAVTGATSYTWTLPSGWTGSSTTTSITATVGANSGNISVTANNSCGNSTAQTLAATVNTAPAQPGAIAGNITVNVGQTLNYSIGAVSAATGYNWSVSGGGSITSGQNTTAVSVSWLTAGNYTLSVNATNNCGTGSDQTLNITVSVVTGVIDPNNPFEIKINPNPSQAEFYLTAKGVINKVIYIEIVNLAGQTVYSSQQRAGTNDYLQLLNLNKVAAGLYKVKIFIDKKIFVKTILKTN